MRKIVSLIAVLVMALAPALFVTGPAQAAPAYLHHCGNPSTVVNNVRAGLCATLDGDVGWVSIQSEAFCQYSYSPYSQVACNGIEAGVDLLKWDSNSASWVMIHHSTNKYCGSFGGSACTSGRLYVPFDGAISTCTYFVARARASIRLPSGTQISGIVLETSAWWSC